MADQDEKIHWTDPSFTKKRRISMKSMINKITDQKSGGESQRTEHQFLVKFTILVSNCEVSGRKTKRTKSVKKSIERGEKTHIQPGLGADRFPKVEKPKKENEDHGADQDHGSDRCPV